jgi:hypothetical protein
MNEIFAIDPRAPEDFKDIKFMLEKFGMREGRFIGKYPSDWVEMVMRNSENLSDLDRSRLVRILDLHKSEMIDIEADFIRSQDWLDNAIKQKINSNGFSRVLATEPNSFNSESLKSFLWDAKSIDDASRGAHIPMEVGAYVSAVRPLFILCSEIHLADPYFRIRRDGVNIDRGRSLVLREFLRAADNSRKCESFIIHFSRDQFMKESEQERLIEEDLNHFISDTGIKSVQIGFDLKNNMPHGRYIFSVKGGLQFDYGFEPRKGKTNHVHWLSQNELEPLFDFYDL